MPTVKLVEDPSIKASCSPLKVLQQEVTKAYFATREEKEVIIESDKDTVIDHTTTKGQTLSKIAKQYGVELKDVERTKTTKYLQIGEIVKVTQKGEKGKEVKFTEITQAAMNKEVYLIVETKHLQTEKVLINILQGEEDCLAKKDQAVTVQQDGNDTICVKATVGDYCEDEEISNKDDFQDWAIAKINLQPKDEEKAKEWSDGLVCVGSNKALLYVLVDVHSENSMCDFESKYIDYKGYKGATDDSKILNHFLNEDGAWFEVSKSNCFCDRDITLEECTDIIHKLRDSEKIGYDLFTAKNCKLPSSDKTIDKFNDQLNVTFKKYDINNCARKIHFLAQVYHETDRFRTTKEYSSSGSYKPYFGRGLMQLTWESNYKIYKSYSGVDCVTDYELIANNLENAFDSAGWYWKQGKKLSVGTTWKAPSGAPSYVKVHNPSYPKTTIEYKVDGKTKKYGTVDFGLIADNDTEDVISYLVNGGSNGLKERQDYVKTLKEIFKYPKNCVTKGGGTGNESSEVTIRLTRKWSTTKSTIGEFTIDDSDVTGYILEEKGPDTTVSGLEQRIPTGTYNLEWHSGTKFKKALKLYNSEVSKARAILIHGGNTAADTEGCLLPGTTKATDFVGSSQAKLKEIFKVIEDEGIEGAKIIITDDYE